MIPSLTPTTFVILIFGVLTFIFLMFLPALLELKRSKDAGPRKIMDDIIAVQHFQLGQIVSLASIEEEKLGPDRVFIKKVVDIIAFLPNLEG